MIRSRELTGCKQQDLPASPEISCPLCKQKVRCRLHKSEPCSEPGESSPHPHILCKFQIDIILPSAPGSSIYSPLNSSIYMHFSSLPCVLHAFTISPSLPTNCPNHDAVFSILLSLPLPVSMYSPPPIKVVSLGRSEMLTPVDTCFDMI
jgi:hypothetical protein